MRRVATGIMGPSVLIDVCLASEEKPEQNISYWENSPGMNRKGNMALFLLWRVPPFLPHICLTLPGFRFDLCLLSLLRSHLLTAPHCQTAPSSQTYFFVFAYSLLFILVLHVLVQIFLLLTNFSGQVFCLLSYSTLMYESFKQEIMHKLQG